MLVFMKCVAEAVMAKGLRGLIELLPGGAYLHDVAADAAKRLQDRRRHESIRDELQAAAEASFEEARAAAEQVAREVASANPTEERLALELYLSQVPGTVRRSLRRPEDHTGRSVPPGFAIDTPGQLLQLLPAQMPRFRTGQPLPTSPRWTLLEPLGVGGFGEVWKVGHELVPDVRAVKFCTDSVAKERFLTHEGKLISRVMRECRGPHVVGLLDADLTGETPWLAYEYIPGGDLAGLILSWQKLPAEQRLKRAIAAFRILAETTGHCHRLTPPIVHRDLKPANILVADDGTLKITDFGIGGIAAQRLLSGSRDGVTAYTRAVSMLAGAYTPIYASPQQQRGELPDPRDDIHALGVIAYQMLTGRLDVGPGPRFDRSLTQAGAPAKLVDIIGACVDPEAQHRPKNGGELFEQLAEVGTVASTSPPRPPVPAQQPAAAAPRQAEVIVVNPPSLPVPKPPSQRELAANFERWKNSGWPQEWVRIKGGKWGEKEWHEVAKWLEGSKFWPLPLLEVHAELERVTREYQRSQSRPAAQPDSAPARERQKTKPTPTPPKTAPASPRTSTSRRGRGPLLLGLLILASVIGVALLYVGVFYPELYQPGSRSEPPPTPKQPPRERFTLETAPRDLTPARTLRGHTTFVNRALEFLPDKRRALSGDQSGKTIVWNLDSGIAQFTLQGEAPYHSSPFSRDGALFAAAGDDKDPPAVWDLTIGKRMATLAEGPLYASAQISPDGTRVVSTRHGKAIVWNAATGQQLATMHGKTFNKPLPNGGSLFVETIWKASFSPDGRRVITSGSDDTVEVWDERTGGKCFTLNPENQTIDTAKYSPDGTKIVTVGRDGGIVKVWTAEGQLISRFDAGKGFFMRAEFSPDGRKVVTNGDKGLAIVWDVATGRELLRLDGKSEYWCPAARFSPDGKRVVTVAGGRAILWDAETGEPLHIFGAEGISEVAISPDGNRLLTDGKDYIVQLWNIPQR